MKTILPLIVGALLLCGCSSRPSPSAVTGTSATQPSTLDGAYELVSVTTTTTKPEKSTEQLAPPDWTGMWLFHNGRFSQTLMKGRRSWNPFPGNQQELGYRAAAGTYEVAGDKLHFKHEYSLNPYGISQPVTVEYSLAGDTLTMTEKFYPHMEDLSEGQTIIVLKRLK